jgi:hypothetical protein
MRMKKRDSQVNIPLKKSGRTVAGKSSPQMLGFQGAFPSSRTMLTGSLYLHDFPGRQDMCR